MLNISFLLIVLVCLLQKSLQIFPTPKSLSLSDSEFLQIPNPCMIRHIFSENKESSEAILKIFKQAQTQTSYYLNKILKRQNNNKHCENDKILIKEELKNKFIDLMIQQNSQKVQNKQGYIIEVNKESPHIKIIINTYTGYVYALETLSQMINENKVSLGTVQDEPLVPHRGIMIDSARHFLKVETISRLIESMPLSKLNILHWHLSDDESFTIKLNSFPELAESSAFKKGQFYTIDQVKQLLALAKKNGVFIVPQLDTPAHVRAWGVAQKWKSQNITIICPRGQGYNAQFDMSKNVVYEIGQTVYKQIDNLFKDAPYIHLGGDQVFGACWDLRPAIKTFMATKNIKDYGELQMYWRHLMKQALPQNRSVVFWRNDAQNIKVADNDVIQFWGAQADAAKILGNSTSKIILSPSDFLYINKGIGNIWFNSSAGSYSVWKQIYKGFELFPQGVNKDRILGAQVTLWGEVSNDDTLENNIWTRATAFAAKLWSNQPSTIKELVKGVVAIQNQLYKMNVAASPIVSQFCQKFTDKCLLS